MQQILRLARHDGAALRQCAYRNDTISVDQIIEGGLEGLQEEIADACKWGNIFGIALYHV